MDTREFLKNFVEKAEKKSRQHALAIWLLETTGSSDAADLVAELQSEYAMLFNDREVFDRIVKAEKEENDPLLKRELQVLILKFKAHLMPPDLLEKIAKKEAGLAEIYANFRPEFEEKPASENEILQILKNEKDPVRRKNAWEASKKIGDVLAPKILELVGLRNEAARSLGYSDYFAMQLDLQEVDEKWLLETFQELSLQSDAAYNSMIGEIEHYLCERFNVEKAALGPWAWKDPFSQEDPMAADSLDPLLQDADLCAITEEFFGKMGFDIQPILKKSDMWERPGKNQHAFCINIDRKSDVRTLNNVKPSVRWLETLFHEFGHAVYELGFDEKLPWLLREPPHMFLTEAMAMIAGRQAYRYGPIQGLADDSLRRHQLIISRWIIMMTAFERELYRNPQQDLNTLWWELVQKYQKITPPKGREGKNDWAAKFHIGLAPVYYFSYLLGEMFASAMEEALGTSSLATKKAGQFFREKLFHPGSRMPWPELVQHVTGNSLNSKAWVKQFA